MKKILLTTILLFIPIGCLSTPCQFDQKTVENMKHFKKIYVEDVEKAEKGKLHPLMKQSAIDFIDSAIAREQAKE